MKASEAAAILDGAQITGVDSEFLRLRANSRSIRPGDAFIAVKGSADNGHRYIEDAVKAGARVIICNPGACMADLHAATIIEVRDTREALKHLLPALYPEARRLRLIGITGTNGKTTTSYLL